MRQHTVISAHFLFFMHKSVSLSNSESARCIATGALVCAHHAASEPVDCADQLVPYLHDNSPAYCITFLVT